MVAEKNLFFNFTFKDIAPEVIGFVDLRTRNSVQDLKSFINNKMLALLIEYYIILKPLVKVFEDQQML